MTKYDQHSLTKFQNDISVGEEHLKKAHPPTPEQVRRAQKAVARTAATAEEAEILLQMLGIHERV